MPEVKQRSMATQKVAAYLKLMQESEGMWQSLIIFLGALFLLGAIPFYPVFMVPLLALACGIVGYRVPWLGTLLSMVFTLPAIAYQSPIFGWVFLLALAIVLFEMFEHWKAISFLQILIMAPFSFGQQPIFGWITILGMVIGSFHFGSKKSLLISIPSVLMILLLSSLWLVENSAFMPIHLALYKPGMGALQLGKPEVNILALPLSISSAVGSMFTIEATGRIIDAVGLVFGNLGKILFSDTGMFQLIGWALALYLCSYLSGQFKRQVYATAALLIVLIVYLAVGLWTGSGLNQGFVLALAASVASIALLDYFNIQLTREIEEERAEKQKTFGKFGLQDMAMGKSEKSLADIGDYEDVKEELKDAILIPLEKKELAYTYGIKPPAGILLFGPPGTGKTMMMRALAKELRYGFYYIKSSDILSQWYGESLVGNEPIVIRESDGQIKMREIGRVVEERQKVKVLSFDQNSRVVFADIKDWIKHRSTSPIYEVRTRTGRSIRVTGYHSLFIFDGKDIQSIPTAKLIPKKSWLVVPGHIELAEAMSENAFWDQFKNNGKDNRLRKISEGIYLDRVEEIKRVEDEEFVYDISVDPCQNFVGGFGGIFAHNSEKNVSEIFSLSRKNAPSILFFDEIDSIGKKRTAYSADDVGPRLLSVLLQEMDGLKTSKPVLVVGATNIPSQLDPALLRPGRFDKIIYMHLPPREARREILKVHLRNVPVDSDVDLEKLAKKTERFSGADLRNVVQEAVKLAAKEASRQGKVVAVSMAYILQVLEHTKPSTGLAALEDYERFKLDFERRIGGTKEEKPREEIVKWEDVAGLSQVKTALLETIELPLLHEAEMRELKVKPSKGILLFGPPGTGKTLIAKAASSELKASFQTISGAELLREGYTRAVGVIKETFNRARENSPSIIFIDEIETLAPSRGAIGTSSEVLGQFLTELDGIRELKGVVLIGATNKPSFLDPALLRPGRFDKIFYIPPPDKETRTELFRLHLGALAAGLNLPALADATEGFSGADIAAIAQEVKMQALREKIAGRVFKSTTEFVLKVMRRRRPSITPEMLKEFEVFIEVYGERGGGEEEGGEEKKEPELHYR